MLAGSVYAFIKDNLCNYDGNYMEIGIWDGGGISYIADRYPDKKLYAIDPFIDDGNTTHISGVGKGGKLLNIKKDAIRNIQGRKNIKLFEIKSEDFKEDSDLNISAVLIDGDHSFSVAVLDYKLAMKLIGDKKGMIIFDDVQVPDVSLAVDDFKKEFYNRIENTGIVSGATAIYFKIKST